MQNTKSSGAAVPSALTTIPLFIFAMSAVAGSILAYPCRLVLHTKWGERSLILGGLATVLAYGFGLCFVHGATQVLVMAFPSLFAIWIARILYLLLVEQTGPRPHSWSMGSLPELPDDMISKGLSNLIPLVAGLWVLAFCPTCSNFAYYLFLAALGGQYSDIAGALIVRWKLLDARDHSIAGEALNSHVEERPDAGGSADPDLSKIF